MSLAQELKSWTNGVRVDINSIPQPGEPAPSNNLLQLPRDGGMPVLITFLRHCGCPFAERDFLALGERAAQNPDILFVAVSHSSEGHTARWLDAIGGKGSVQVVVDESRQLYADWGLGPSSWSHVLSVGGLAAAYKLGKEKAIWNRPTESGSRWQTAGTLAVNRQGTVVWARKAERADEEPDWQAAINALRDVDERARL